MSYKEQLLTQEWRDVRDRIIERDNHQCQLCMSSELLHVHHKQYIANKKAWEYPDNCLITLCDSCHSKFHNKEGIPVLSYPHYNVDILAISERTARSVQSLAKLRDRIMLKEIEKMEQENNKSNG